MSKVKSIFKRSLAILLAMLTVLSVGITSAIALNLDMAQTAGYVDLAETGADAAINKGNIVWFDNSSKKWGNVTLHVWGGTSQETAWPGIYMTPVDSSNKNGLYYWVSTGNYASCVFSNAGSSKSSDLKTQGDGYVYNGTSWSQVSDNTNYDLLSVLRGQKIMFYIGESGSWGQSTFYLYNSSSAIVTNGVEAFYKDSNDYTVVAAPSSSSYRVGHSGYTTSKINETPASGSAYIAGGNNADASKTKDGYSMTISLGASSIAQGSNVGVTETSIPSSHFTSTNEMQYYYTTDASVIASSTFTKLTKSGSNLVTSGLGVGTYYIYPVYHDGYVYTRGSAMTLAVTDPVVTPATPAAPTVEFPDSFGGTGTQEDPFLVEPKDLDSKVKMNVYGELGDADGLAYNVNYYGSKVDWAVGVEEKIGYEDLNAPALDEIIAVNTYLWAYNVNGDTKKYSDNYATTTLYIKGAYKNVTVTFKDWDGTVIGEPQSIPYGGSATAPSELPFREGYTFTGWDKEFSNVTSSELVVTALYEAQKRTITFINDDGSPIGITPVDYDSKVVDALGSAPAADKKDSAEWDYAFEKWVYSDGTVIGDNDLVQGNITLKATYTETKQAYTVNYSGDFGEVVVKQNGNIISSGSKIEYGTELELVVTDTDKFYKAGTWYVGTDAIEGTTYTVTGNVTLEHKFTRKTTYKVTFNVTGAENGTYSFVSASGGEYDESTYEIEAGGTFVFDFKANQNYYISKLGDTLYTGEFGNTIISDFAITPTKDTTIDVVFTEQDKYKVTVNANIDGAEVTGGGTVHWGSITTLEAKPVTGYSFAGWKASNENYRLQSGALENVSVTIIPNADVEFTANYKPVTGTINVTAGEGGTVEFLDGTEDGEVTYPDIVKAKATGDASQGYEFTHWTVESAGKEDTDYKVTEKDNVIEVQILTQDTVVNVTANFANSQKIKVYIYSDSCVDRLTMTESNGTKTNTPVNNETQDTIKFGDETWYTPGEVSLTPGFNTSITAQLFGDNPLVGGTGNLVMFQDTLGWGQVYFYNKSTSMYLPDVHTDKIDKAVCTEGVTAKPMSRIGTSNYYYIYVTESVDYIAFSKDGQSNYFWMYATQACYRGNDTGHKASTPMFVPKNKLNYSTNGTNYYNEGSWVETPTISTQTDPIDITSELYDGNVWKGVEEIWIYIKADGTYIATTENRRQLIDYVGSSLIKRTYNNGVNDMEYKSNLWTAFKNAYTAALGAAGDYTLTEAQLKTKYDALVSAYEALEVEPNITITGSHGAEPHTNSDVYFGKTSFKDITTSTGKGNIGDYNSKDTYHQENTYIYATIDRYTTVTIQTNVESAYETDYLVYGWVVNGTEWVPATQDIKDTSLYVGTYKCDKSAIFVPIYFRKSTIANWETDSNIAKIYASTAGSSEKWGNYISAYTWTTDKNYYQFGHWTGQLMIPDTSNPGMYYTFLEFKSPTGNSDVAGIAFTNYGNNTPINTNARYQTYDYYEFKELKDLGYDNIVFQLKTFEGNDNYPKTSKETLASYNFDYFRDFSGNLIDINREKVVEERTIPDPALYIVRTGPVKYTDGAGKGWGNLEGSDFYVDAYIYKPDGTYLGRCKTYELTNLEKLAKPVAEGGRNIDLTKEEYKGKPVMIDYASLTTDSGDNKRFDGEWFGTKYGLTNVTIKTEVAFQGENGTIQYFPGQNEVEGVGNAYFNGLHFQEVSHGSENHTISAIVADGNDFVGWYKATVADDGTYTIDTTAKPLFTERSVTIDASADAVYVAVFKTHPEGTFTVNNYYYTYDDFKGQPMGEHLPPVFGNDTTYSIRDVKIHKIYDAYSQTDVSLGNKFAGTYTQSMGEISVGDKLEITIRTTPTYTRDYVYAWYVQSNEADGKINFEEVGTNEIQGDTTPGATKEFTFIYTVEPGVDTITIYSDVVHISPQVTFTYIYNNRYNQEQKYIVKHTLTDSELQNFDDLKSNEEFNTKIFNMAPYVGDLYKNVTWEIENISADATNWTLRATENDVYTVNVNVNGKHKTFEGKFNETISIYAKDINPNFTDSRGLWYLEKGEEDNMRFDAGVDEILGYGTYYGLVITGDAQVYFTSKIELINQIILADAVYGYERATDGSGNVTTNKVYIDYLISMLLNVYTGGYIDVNGNGEQDANEPTVIDEENTNTPVSLKAISDAGYVVDYGMVHELLNTFGSNKDDILKHFYKSNYEMDNAKLKAMLKSGSSVAEGEYYDGALATYFYHYSAIDYKDYATNKNRVIMTFGYDNTDFNRSMFYNVKAYLTISVPGTTTINDANTMFVFSNQATLNIAEADDITNGNTTNS